MTLFDLVGVGVLAASALIGFSRGAVREIVNLFAFTLAALASVFLLPFSRPLAHHAVHPSWAANAVAIVAVFLIAYIALRIFGASLSTALHRQTALGTIDRSVGLGFGVVRALVLLGVFYLVFNAATPAELVPSWISGGALYPVSRVCARVLAAVAPRGLKAMGGFGHVLKDKVTASDSPDEWNGIDTGETTQRGLRGEPVNSQDHAAGADHPYEARPPKPTHRRRKPTPERDLDQVD